MHHQTSNTQKTENLGWKKFDNKDVKENVNLKKSWFEAFCTHFLWKCILDTLDKTIVLTNLSKKF